MRRWYLLESPQRAEDSSRFYGNLGPVVQNIVKLTTSTLVYADYIMISTVVVFLLKKCGNPLILTFFPTKNNNGFVISFTF